MPCFPLKEQSRDPVQEAIHFRTEMSNGCNCFVTVFLSQKRILEMSNGCNCFAGIIVKQNSQSEHQTQMTYFADKGQFQLFLRCVA